MRQDTLAFYPFVIVRLACRYCKRQGQYRLARLGARYDPDTPLDELIKELSADCHHRKARLTKRWPEGCGAYFPDLEGPRQPPDLPPQRLRVIKGGLK